VRALEFVAEASGLWSETVMPAPRSRSVRAPRVDAFRRWVAANRQAFSQRISGMRLTEVTGFSI
jgi:hypothetical protein